jgi:hypothetical protein
MKTHKLTIPIGTFILLASFISQAQRTPSRLTDVTDVGVAISDKGFMASFQYNEYLKLERTGILQVGWGVRASHLSAKDLDFTSAPSQFAKQVSTTDTLQMGRATVTSLSFSVAAQISFFNRLDLGVSTDILGLATGGKRTGYHLGSAGFRKDSLNIHQTYQIAKPTGAAIQFFGNSQRGNLNSEIYARLRVSSNFGIKAGYVFAVNEYKTDNVLVDDNNRFRARHNLFYVGLSISLAN